MRYIKVFEANFKRSRNLPFTTKWSCTVNSITPPNHVNVFFENINHARYFTGQHTEYLEKTLGVRKKKKKNCESARFSNLASVGQK
jgi:hypothetical protein